MLRSTDYTFERSFSAAYWLLRFWHLRQVHGGSACGRRTARAAVNSLNCRI
eukprot:m.86888 g.86888  ORF g.86888 m.86888 type:complete len:51 (+) comp11500_c0_seq3:831-983(+)